MNHLRKALLIPALLALLAAACNLPGLGTPPTPFPSSQGQEANAAYTAAAETIIAQLTQVSNPSGPTLTIPVEETAAGTISPPSSPSAAAPSVTTAVETNTPELQLSPTETQAPTATSEPTAALAAGDPRAGLGDPTWTDTFDAGDDWYLGADEYAGFEVDTGDLVMTSFVTGSRNSWMLAQPKLVNFYLEVSFTPQDCTGLDRYGLIVRSDAVVGYLLTFSCDGRYTFRKWNGQRATKLVEWTESPSIMAGPNQVNRMGIRAEGDQFSLYANGNLLGQVSDSSYAEGGFGMVIGADTTEEFTALAGEAAYWELP
jgi:hypothetical protein